LESKQISPLFSRWTTANRRVRIVKNGTNRNNSARLATAGTEAAAHDFNGNMTALGTMSFTIAQALGDCLAGRRNGDPIGQRVMLAVHTSCDLLLRGRLITGRILVTTVGDDLFFDTALVDLDAELDYRGHRKWLGIRRIVAASYLPSHRLRRLLNRPAAVAILLADSFEADARDRVFALATMRLVR
jgi:hypothetical protein